MLPRNNMRDKRMRKLRVFPGPDHPFKGVELVPWQMPPRQLQDRGLGWLPPQGFEPLNPQAYLQRMMGSKLLVQQAQLEQQQQQQLQVGGQQPGLLTGQASGSGSSSSNGPVSLPQGEPIGFEDLLSAEELSFVTAAMQRQQ
jgi:hypothetical protein